MKHKYAHRTMNHTNRYVIRHALPVILLILHGLIFDRPLLGAPVDSLVTEANRHYMNLEYQKAATLYLSAVEEGYVSPALYYNLGNACYKLNQLARAILYYEKARELAPFDEDIRNNLQMANALVVDKVEAIPVFFLTRWWHNMTGLMLPDGWAVVSLILFVSAMLFVFFFITASERARHRKAFLVAGTILLLLAIQGYASGISRKRAIIGNQYAIIMAPSVTIKSSPDELGTVVFVLHEGTRVEIVEKLEDWREIRIANGSKGWVTSNVIGEI